MAANYPNMIYSEYSDKKKFSIAAGFLHAAPIALVILVTVDGQPHHHIRVTLQIIVGCSFLCFLFT